MDKFIITHNKININEFLEAANNFNCKIEYREQVKSSIIACRKLLDDLVDSGRIIYGVNTSMGGFVNYLVPTEHAEDLQNNLLSSVASNVGDFFEDNVVRSIMLARLISLSKGASAISLENFDILLKMLNSNVLPCIPMKGSLGASGDLGPLAFIALVGVGKWKAKYNGEILEGKEALAKANITPMRLGYKEGLALINGTSAMVGLSANVYNKAKNLLNYYEYITGLTFEGLAATLNPYDPIVHKRKMHKGQLFCAERICDILSGSKLAVMEKDRESSIQEKNKNIVQGLDSQIEDAYSLRCTPQILGPIYDSIDFIHRTIENELNSSSDNPLALVEEGEVFHNGHFHGQYISMVMDFLSINLTTLSNLSDRRIDRFMDKNNSNGLPPFLCRENPGLRLGLMGGQFMSTSITAENRALCTPVSIQTLTSTGDFQDIVSFGLVSARKCKEILINTAYIVSFEALCACQAIDIRGKEKMSKKTRILFNKIREIVPYFSYDTTINPYVEKLHEMFINDNMLKQLKTSQGELK